MSYTPFIMSKGGLYTLHKIHNHTLFLATNECLTHCISGLQYHHNGVGFGGSVSPSASVLWRRIAATLRRTTTRAFADGRHLLGPISFCSISDISSTPSAKDHLRFSQLQNQSYCKNSSERIALERLYFSEQYNII